MAQTYSPCPRPILKRPNTNPEVPSTPLFRDEPTELLAIDRGILQPVVRFPTRPGLTKTYTAHPASQYDRSPIVVQPNRCALPERGCPGRTYSLDDKSPRPSSSRARSPGRAGRHLHPRASAVAFREDNLDDEVDEDDDLTPRATPVATMPTLPPLVPDLSSESDESDGFTSPPSELAAVSASYSRTGLAIPRSRPKDAAADSLGLSFSAMQLSNSPSALSFLPHPPSPRSRTTGSPSSPTRSHHGHSSGHAHTPEEERAYQRYAASLSMSSSPQSTTNSSGRSRGGSPTRKRHPRTRTSVSPEASQGRYKALSERSALSGCGLAVPDQGCLGGF